MGLVLRVGAFLLVVGAAVFLALTPSGEQTGLRILAAAVVTLPAAYALYDNLSGRTDLLGQDSRLRVKRCLQAALVDVHHARIYPDDIMQVSFHVWIVPKWYRRLIPYRVRKRFGATATKLPQWTRPHLTRHSIYRFEHHQSAEVGFRKGVGVIGRCIERNREKDLLVVALDRQKYRRALRSDEAWESATVEVTQGLRRRDAARLADTYGQVAALVLRETRGEAIGCVTLDLPPGASLRLSPKPAPGSPEEQLVEILRKTTRSVENHLTRRGH